MFWILHEFNGGFEGKLLVKHFVFKYFQKMLFVKKYYDIEAFSGCYKHGCVNVL